MAGDPLQRIFKTLADPTRVRILALLERDELSVQDLMDVLGMAQSRVSRHLGILREAGLLDDRRDGTFVFYRFPLPTEGAWRDAWELVRRERRDDPVAERDRAALERRLEKRRLQTRAFFDSVGAEWDALRKVFDDDLLRARAINRLVAPGLRVADVGTGTGVLAIELARLGMRVTAVDQSEQMLAAARKKLASHAGLDVQLRHGDIAHLPIGDAEMDASLAHMVLRYLPSPADAIREMARVVRPGGVVVVIDFERHDREWMREELGVLWLGFPADEVRSWMEAAGLEDVAIAPEATTASGELPAAFVATGRRPD